MIKRLFKKTYSKFQQITCWGTRFQIKLKLEVCHIQTFRIYVPEHAVQRELLLNFYKIVIFSEVCIFKIARIHFSKNQTKVMIENAESVKGLSHKF